MPSHTSVGDRVKCVRIYPLEKTLTKKKKPWVMNSYPSVETWFDMVFLLSSCADESFVFGMLHCLIG